MGFALGLFGFLLTTAYCPFIAGAAVTPRWLLLACVVPTMLIGLLLDGQRIKITVAHVVGSVFLGWMALSLAWSATPYDSVDVLWQMALLGGCFALGSAIDDCRPFLVGCAIGIGVSSGLLMIEAASGWTVERLANTAAVTPYAGLFGNRNYLGEAAAVVLVGFMALDAEQRKWPLVPFWALICLMPALALCRSRGGFLAVAVAYAWMLWSAGYRRLVIGLGAAALLALIAAVVFSHDSSILDRLHIWGDAVLGLTIFGRGIGSFGGSLVAYFTDPMALRNIYTHNEFLQIFYELGVPGLVLFVVFGGFIVFGTDYWPRYVFVAALVEGCFGFSFHMPVTGAVGLLMAGAAARCLPWLCDEAKLGRGRLSSR